MSSCEIYSHPGKLLQDHISAVSNFCGTTCRDSQPDFSSVDLSADTLAEFCTIIGYCHDFGKATSFFQEYLFASEDTHAALKGSPKTRHGLLSAVFTYQCIKLAMIGRPYGKINDFLPFVGYVIVRRHHGDLNDFFLETKDLGETTTKEVLTQQLNAIRKETVSEIYKGKIPENSVETFFSEFESILEAIKKEGSLFKIRRTLDNIPEATAMEILILFCYSLLLSGDKQDAAEVSHQRNTAGLPPDLVDRYQQQPDFQKVTSPINQIRNEIYHEVIDQVPILDLGQRIYSLNVPTGTGKTLTSVSFSLKLRDRITQERGITPRIVYCLPFMSIIDQNFEVISKVITTYFRKSPSTDILLKHHHLADVFYSTDDEDYQDTKAQFMIEGWQSEFIITTFIQFFHSILSSKNRAIRKYYTLANAIVILDEVQSIPHEYWELFHDVIIGLSTHLHTTFIFMTATQPLIFDEKTGEIKELALHKAQYFKKFDRIELTVRNDPIPLKKFEEDLREHIVASPDKSFLIVLNTINTAQQIYRSFFEHPVPDTEYVFLSTHITPKERLERIREIKDTSCKRRKIVVSTQLIEAGVDIDVDIVYRDMAPLDSINQVAGRCNRNNRQNTCGKVILVTLMDDKKPYYRYIYSEFLIDKTRAVLAGKETIRESQFIELNNEYYEMVKDMQGDDPANEILTCVKYLKFSQLQEKFHLIRDDYPKVDLFVEIDEHSHAIWNEYLAIRERTGLERKTAFLSIKKEFYNYVISVPKAKAGRLANDDIDIGHISQEELKIWYNPETGFTPNDGGTLFT